MIGAIIQARTSSTRLPGKVLLELPYGSGITVLQQVIRRLKQSKKIETIVVATTEDRADDAIVDIASREGVSSFRGSKENVLERYYLAAKTFGLDTVVRITSDCPCVDPELVDHAVEEHFERMADYTSVKGFPRGLDAEVFGFNSLVRAYQGAERAYETEHVTPFIYNHPDMFRFHTITASNDLAALGIRVTLDTEEDYSVLCTVYDYLYNTNPYFDMGTVITLFKQKPWLQIINNKILQKKDYCSLQDELKEAAILLELQDMRRASDYMRRSIFDWSLIDQGSQEAQESRGAKEPKR
jgi:spore coat polysaccharide biosynthesis protein SpsF